MAAAKPGSVAWLYGAQPVVVIGPAESEGEGDEELVSVATFADTIEVPVSDLADSPAPAKADAAEEAAPGGAGAGTGEQSSSSSGREGKR